MSQQSNCRVSIKMPKSYTASSDEEIEYDGGFMDGCSDVVKGIVIAGIIATSLVAIYGSVKCICKNKSSFTPSNSGIKDTAANGYGLPKSAPNRIDVAQYNNEEVLISGTGFVRIQDGYFGL